MQIKNKKTTWSCLFYFHKLSLYIPLFTISFTASFTSIKSSLYVIPYHFAEVDKTETLDFPALIKLLTTVGKKNSQVDKSFLFASKNSLK